MICSERKVVTFKTSQVMMKNDIKGESLKVMSPSVEMLDDLKWRAFRIKPFHEGKDAKWTNKAIVEYETLVDRFFIEYQEMITPQQYEASKQNFEYFMTILTLTEAYMSEVSK